MGNWGYNPILRGPITPLITGSGANLVWIFDEFCHNGGSKNCGTFEDEFSFQKGAIFLFHYKKSRGFPIHPNQRRTGSPVAKHLWLNAIFPETNTAPENKVSQKETSFHQPSIFRCDVLVSGKVVFHKNLKCFFIFFTSLRDGSGKIGNQIWREWVAKYSS